MFIALDKLYNQGLRQAIVVVPEKSIGSSFNDEPLRQVWLLATGRFQSANETCVTRPVAMRQGRSRFRQVSGQRRQGVVCTHATFRFAVDKVFGIEGFDDRPDAVDEIPPCLGQIPITSWHASGALVARDKVHLVCHDRKSYFPRRMPRPSCHPRRRRVFDTVHLHLLRSKLTRLTDNLKSLDIGYFLLFRGSYTDEQSLKVLDRPRRRFPAHTLTSTSARARRNKHREFEAHHRRLGRLARHGPRNRVSAGQ